MRSTIIEQEAGFLGPFQRKLQPGQTQHLTFQPDDVGPCWMTPAEQEASRHDTIIGVPKEIQRSRAQLIFDLAAKGANTKGKNKSDLVFLGRKDSFGLIECNTSLRHLMSLCSDFLNEQGMMQYIGTKLGVEVMLSPKCHAEIAGEGVEYMWACAKGTYRNLAHTLDSGLFEPELQQQRSKHGPVEIDNLIKKMKTHRCALDFDYKFVMNGDE